MTILITGATGNVGRPLVHLLTNAGANVRAVTRQPIHAGLPPRVETVESARAGLRGATAVFLNSRALGDDLADFAKQAVHEGVTRLVALSAINCEDDFSRQPSRFRGDRNKEVEQYAVESGVEWVSLRPTVFASNFLGMWSTQLTIGDVVRGPYAFASAAPIADRDISEVAAHALLTDDLVGQRVPLTGPQAFTNAGLLAVLGKVLHRPLEYLQVPDDFVRQRFTGLGFPDGFADAYLAMQAATLTAPAVVTHEVDRILGRPAETFASWANRFRAEFARTEFASQQG
ncbi:NAD(P)H-binding protein [Mycobacterium sp. CBMA271]|uniref:NmrA family NAD(P)-binding protein n=1 Tax=unclassified Mycobacteroides TaxID=2618759 RepID=UPI0012DC68B7|nr:MULTISPECIES: NAD(P)H-binding protein [unclassified Mycobacteroides]MUM17311.1 nucleoside-diphosphate sugar epimerase [Mycobacteroides sp. CBMA 326]MUM23854.1 NAD(P)H-binding protein [Mycobacteroides sp. CBMA 271]